MLPLSTFVGFQHVQVSTLQVSKFAHYEGYSGVRYPVVCNFLSQSTGLVGSALVLKKILKVANLLQATSCSLQATGSRGHYQIGPMRDHYSKTQNII